MVRPTPPVTLVLVTTDDGRVVYCRKRSFRARPLVGRIRLHPRGEPAEVTALREVKEETGLDAEIVRFMGTHVYDPRPDQIVIAFWVRVTGGVPIAGDDVDEIEIAPPTRRDCVRRRMHWLVNYLVQNPEALAASLPRAALPG
ncbi:MAG: NUDIX domain-containing protein [Dehalococcoidia bacterium]